MELWRQMDLELGEIKTRKVVIIFNNIFSATDVDGSLPYSYYLCN